jgi:hypothetical protein
MEGAEPVGVDAAWRRLEQDWASEEAHRRFIAFCAMHGALDQAGRHYRNVRDTDPARRDAASLRLHAVMEAAVEQLSRPKVPRSSKSRRLMWLMVGACGFAIIRAVLALLHRGSQ